MTTSSTKVDLRESAQQFLAPTLTEKDEPFGSLGP